jgi:hypothetical protein
MKGGEVSSLGGSKVRSRPLRDFSLCFGLCNRHLRTRLRGPDPLTSQRNGRVAFDSQGIYQCQYFL